jgi:hypothetical protein
MARFIRATQSGRAKLFSNLTAWVPRTSRGMTRVVREARLSPSPTARRSLPPWLALHDPRRRGRRWRAARGACARTASPWPRSRRRPGFRPPPCISGPRGGGGGWRICLSSPPARPGRRSSLTLRAAVRLASPMGSGSLDLTGPRLIPILKPRPSPHGRRAGASLRARTKVPGLRPGVQEMFPGPPARPGRRSSLKLRAAFRLTTPAASGSQARNRIAFQGQAPRTHRVRKGDRPPAPRT